VAATALGLEVPATLLTRADVCSPPLRTRILH